MEVLIVPKARKLDIDYDGEADVLYISFGKPKAADDGILLDNDVILRYKKKELIGITVMGFKERIKEKFHS